MDLSNDIMYGFTFQPFNNTRSLDISYAVYSHNNQWIQKFLKQHGFDTNIAHIDVYDPAIKAFDICDVEVLQEYYFRSNKKEGIFKILTTEYFVTEATNRVGGILSDALTFGLDFINREDVPFVNNLTNIISALDYCMIVDRNVCETSGMSDDYLMRYEHLENHKRYMDLISENYRGLLIEQGRMPSQYYVGNEALDDSYIFDALGSVMDDARIRGEIQPITLEAYISSFVEALTDDFQQ